MTDSKEFADLQQRLRHHVETLAATPRPAGSPAHRAAAIYIGGQLGHHGFPLRTIADRSTGVACLNLLAEPWPNNDTLPLLIVAAHYDSVPDSPGADDNGSAVAALLELARWFASHRPAQSSVAPDCNWWLTIWRKRDWSAAPCTAANCGKPGKRCGA